MKKCIKCKKKKDLETGFHANKRSSDGKTGLCKICTAKRNAKIYAEDKAKKAGPPKPQGRVAKTYPYKDGDLTVKQIMDLPECIFAISRVSEALRKGFSVHDILFPNDKVKEERKAEQKAIREEKAKRREMDRNIIRQSKADIERQRIIKIMAVPVHPMKTALHWLMKNYTHSSGSNMEPIRLTKGSGY